MTAYTSHGLPIIETAVDNIEELPLDINDLAKKSNAALIAVEARANAYTEQYAPIAAEEVAVKNGYIQSAPGKNLYDVSADRVGGYYRQTDGVFVELAGYRGSDFIRVTAGQPYTISHARFVVFYDVAKEFVSGIQQAQGVYTWTPAEDGYVRFSYAFTDTGASIAPVVQMEEGTVATAPVEYKRIIDPTYQLAGSGGSALTVTLAGNDLTIDSTLAADQITLNAKLAGGGNGVFNFDTTVLGTTNIHSTADDIAPIRTQMGTLGANHGFATMGVWEVHDKTAVDLGSVWTDGSREYVLLAIDGSGRAFFGGSYTVTAGVVRMPAINLTANLTHVSGATNTAPLDYMQKLATGAAQLYPAIGRHHLKFILDGATLPEGTAKGNEFEIRESYEVLGYKSLYDTAKANIGVAHTDRPIGGAVRVETTYRFREGCIGSADTAITEMQPTELGACGFVQAVALLGTVTRYLPGVKPINGHDWSAGVPLAGYSLNQLVTSADLHHPSVPALLSLDVRDDIAFVLGYKPWEGDATANPARLAEASNYLWDLRGTKKSYPNTIQAQPAGWGRYETHSYRGYLDPDQAMEVAAAGTDALAAYTALESLTPLPM